MPINEESKQTKTKGRIFDWDSKNIQEPHSLKRLELESSNSELNYLMSCTETDPTEVNKTNIIKLILRMEPERRTEKRQVEISLKRKTREPKAPQKLVDNSRLVSISIKHSSEVPAT